MAARRIGILTGGGDVPGLNSVIKGVVYRATDLGWTVQGIRRGWEGLTHLDLDDERSKERYLVELTRANTRPIDRTGGTWLHTSRTNPSKMKVLPPRLEGRGFQKDDKGRYDITSETVATISRLGLDYLVAIGGDDTLSFAARLNAEGQKVVAIPKTMDNDVRNTEYCIGFSTAITRAMDAVNRQRSTVGSHERVGIFRVFGRDAGYTALYTAYVTSLRCAIPEHEFDLNKMIELLINDKRNNPSHYSMVVLSEGARWEGYQIREYGEPDAFGHRKKMSVAEDFAQHLMGETREETVVSDLTYDLRSGSPDFVDSMVASTFAGMAVDAMKAGETGRMTAIFNGCYAMVDIPDPGKGPRKVDVASMYNIDRYRPSYQDKLGLPLFLTRP